MANLKEIRNRIASVSSTMQITSAMKMVSAAKLKKAQDAITAGITIYAPWTTDELLQNLGSRTLGYSYNLVSLLIGVNNQYRGRSEENFKIELNLLLDLAIGYAANRKEKVFVLSIPGPFH